MKKLLSLMLVLALVLCTSTVAMVASAYDSETVLQLSVDKEQINIGDTVTLTFSIPKISQAISCATIWISFDPTLVTCNNDITGTFSNVWTSTDSSVQEDYICLQLSDPSFEAMYTDADTCTVTASFTAIANGTANFAFIEGEGTCDVFDEEFADYVPFTVVNTSVKVGATEEPEDPDPVPDPTYYMVTFVNENGEEIASVDVEEGKALAAEQIPAIDPSAEYVYGWDKDVTAPITDETTITLTKATRTYTVNAVNATASATSVTYKSAVTVTADAEKDGVAFSYWKKDGKVVSYDSVYKLLVYADTTIEAVYEGEMSATASAYIDTPYYTMSGSKVKMVSSLQVVLPAGVTVSEFKIYRKTRTTDTAYTAKELMATTATTPSVSFNKQGRLDYSILSAKDSAKIADVMFVATLSNGETIESNIVSVGAQFAY